MGNPDWTSALQVVQCSIDILFTSPLCGNDWFHGRKKIWQKQIDWKRYSTAFWISSFDSAIFCFVGSFTWMAHRVNDVGRMFDSIGITCLLETFDIWCICLLFVHWHSLNTYTHMRFVNSHPAVCVYFFIWTTRTDQKDQLQPTRAFVRYHAQVFVEHQKQLKRTLAQWDVSGGKVGMYIEDVW